MSIIIKICSNTSPETILAKLRFTNETIQENLLDTIIKKSSYEMLADANDDYKLKSPCRKVNKLPDGICHLIGHKKERSLKEVIIDLSYTILETIGNWPNSRNHDHFIINISDAHNQNPLGYYTFNEASDSLTEYHEKEAIAV